MAFERIQNTRVRMADHPLVLSLYGKGEVKEIALRLSLPLLAKLGWSPDDRVEMLEGSGPDQGYLLIRRAPGGKPLTKNSDAARVLRLTARLLRHSRLVTVDGEVVAMVPVDHLAFGGELKLLLPPRYFQPVEG